MVDFSGRVVIVTGAAGNLGNAVTRAFQSAGARLTLVDRAEDRLQRLYPDMVDSSDYLLANSVDLTSAEAVQSMVDKTLERFGQIQVLVNTAGGYRAGAPVHETSLETWDFMLNLNARSVFLVSRAVIPHLLQQRYGKIINVAARVARQGRANMAVYSASKSAVVHLTESMAAELKGEGINVNCILPSTIDTPANRRAMPEADYSIWVKPQAIAEVILFLASDSASPLHGVAVPV
ncbi:MAG: SDR family oxidoreductase [Anaerolineales bacterium]|nr:MAG: SDR family oxidoreductase [Anaerolineales bacterium]